MTTTFDALPTDARLWVFTVDRPMTEAEEAHLLDAAAPFLEAWTSHSRPVQAAMRVADGHFVAVAADIPGGEVSGCGIDKLVRHLENAFARIGVGLASGMAVAFRAADGSVHVADRPTFKTLAQQGMVDASTRVFDAAITTLGAWRQGAFERPLADTWMARYLPADARPA